MVNVTRNYDERAVFQAVVRRNPDWRLDQYPVSQRSDLEVNYNEGTVSLTIKFKFTPADLDALLQEAAPES